MEKQNCSLLFNIYLQFILYQGKVKQSLVTQTHIEIF